MAGERYVSYTVNKARAAAEHRRMVRRVVVLTAMLVGVATYGVVGFILTDDMRTLDAIYMTVITMSTVGFGEVGSPVGVLSDAGRIHTMMLILVSLAIVGYSLTTMASFILEGDLQNLLQGRRMDRQISQLDNHVILCGCGNTGKWIAEELFNTGTPFVVIDRSEIAPGTLTDGVEVLCLIGDATDDAVLQEAGIERARGVVSVLSEDKDNVYVVLSARSLNPKLRIISRVIDEDNAGKLLRAGADQVVSPNRIGGLRIASAMVRPTVVGFLDRMLNSADALLRLEDVLIAEGSIMVGKTLAELDVGRQTGAMVVAVRGKNDEFLFNPRGTFRIDSESVLVCLGSQEQIKGVQKLANDRNVTQRVSRLGGDG